MSTKKIHYTYEYIENFSRSEATDAMSDWKKEYKAQFPKLCNFKSKWGLDKEWLNDNLAYERPSNQYHYLLYSIEHNLGKKKLSAFAVVEAIKTKGFEHHYLEAICGNPKSGQAAALLKMIIEKARKTQGVVGVKLSALEHVLLYYRKSEFGFDHAPDCTSKETSKVKNIYDNEVAPARKRMLEIAKIRNRRPNFPKFIEEDQTLKLYIEELLRDKRILNFGCKTREQCGIHGYTMTKCFKRKLGSIILPRSKRRRARMEDVATQIEQFLTQRYKFMHKKPSRVTMNITETAIFVTCKIGKLIFTIYARNDDTDRFLVETDNADDSEASAVKENLKAEINKLLL